MRLLHLEDDAGDAAMIAGRLRTEQLDCDITWVQTRQAFQQALQAQAFDVVLADYELAHLEPLRQVQAQWPELPVVMISDGLSGEEAVECLKAGATDYVLRQRPGRLGYVVRRAMADRQQRAALRRAEEDLRALNAELEARVHQRTAELETANKFLDSIIQHIPYQVLVKDAAQLRLVRVNRRVEEILGRSQQQLLGRTVYEMHMRREEADFFNAKDKEALALGREVDIPEETLHRHDGSVRVLHAKKIPILDENGQARYLLTIAEDVTERKKKEHEIARLNAELAQRSAEAEAASRAKGTFLATMSHEIRTPMNGLLGMLELLSLTELDPEQRETLALVRESSRSLLRIIDDILDFSKIEAGKLEVRPEVVSIRRVIEEVQSIYSGNASSKGLVVRRVVDPRISPALRVDPVRLRQILNNLVSNAIKFTARGAVEISVQCMGRTVGHENLRFMVKDSGIGIAPHDQHRLFQPFTQVEGDLSRRRTGGTGLGLVISRQLAQMMGGTIRLESAPGQGTTVILDLTLPIAEETPAAGPQKPAASPVDPTPRRAAPEVAQAEAEGTLVLLVDDHPVNRMLLQRQLKTLGYAARTASDGVQALEAWQAGRFGLVITDCHMPHMDGLELARSIRRLEASAGAQRVPIIACTANALQGEPEACFAAGMDDFLVKPVELPELSVKMDRWLPVPASSAPSPAAAPKPAAPGPAASPFDEALLMKTCGGDASLVDEVLATFRESCDEDAAGLQRAVAAGDMAGVTQFAHRMAGASRMVGAHALADACALVDSGSRTGDWAAVNEGMPAVHEERERVAAWLARRAGAG